MNLLRFNLNAHPKFLIHAVHRENHFWLDIAVIWAQSLFALVAFKFLGNRKRVCPRSYILSNV